MPTLSELQQKFRDSDKYRLDGSLKGPGWLGPLQHASGKVSTELSIGVGLGGEEVLIPSLVPTLTPDEQTYLLQGNKATPDIVRKAVEHAAPFLRQGKSPFK